MMGLEAMGRAILCVVVAAIMVGTGGVARRRSRPLRGRSRARPLPMAASACSRAFRLPPPPVGDVRWKAPAPVTPWTGVKKAVAFGPRCMQGRIFDDMVFRDEMSEDCLYLNVWTPAAGRASSCP